jgi:hypothetical protein
MANYTATARSNYFAVKDTTAFEAWCKERDLKFWQGTHDNVARYAITPNDMSDTGGWPEHLDEDGDLIEDLCDALAAHLVVGEVAVLFEIGNEKLRYLIGTATAVHSSGKRVDISLSEIYTRARDAFGEDAAITEANY